ncbi:MAG: hypothetical protein R2751_11510 [Bacteroidales bacterium]
MKPQGRTEQILLVGDRITEGFTLGTLMFRRMEIRRANPTLCNRLGGRLFFIQLA